MVRLSYTKGILKVYDWQGIGCDFEIECKGNHKTHFLLAILAT